MDFYEQDHVTYVQKEHHWFTREESDKKELMLRDTGKHCMQCMLYNINIHEYCWYCKSMGMNVVFIQQNS